MVVPITLRLGRQWEQEGQSWWQLLLALSMCPATVEGGNVVPSKRGYPGKPGLAPQQCSCSGQASFSLLPPEENNSICCLAGGGFTSAALCRASSDSQSDAWGVWCHGLGAAVGVPHPGSP